MKNSKKIIKAVICWCAVIVWMCVIFSMSAQKSEQSSAVSASLINSMASIFNPGYNQLNDSEKSRIIDELQHAVRKAAHFTEYFILGVLISLALANSIRRGVRWYLLSLAIGAAYAVTDELHQLAVDGRSAQVTDVLIDSAGVAFGAALSAGIFAIIVYIRKKRAEYI